MRRCLRRWQVADELQINPGIGPTTAQDLRDLGFFAITDLKGHDPELLKWWN